MASSPTPIVFVWTVGLSGYCLPGETGYRIGASTYTHIMLEVSDNTIHFKILSNFLYYFGHNFISTGGTKSTD